MRTEIEVDPDNDQRLIVARYGDHDAMRHVADVCKAMHNEGWHGTNEMRLMGHYPPEVIEIYVARNNITLQEFMREPEHAKNIMRDPALAYFRVWDGRV